MRTRTRTRMRIVAAATAVAAMALAPAHLLAAPAPSPPRRALRVPPGAEAWRQAGRQGVRGVTVGPIENAYHPGVGYGSPAYDRTLDETARAGATWVALTPFGRVSDLHGRGVDPTFEQPFAKNRADVARSVAMAHARGLSVMLVPHLWVESGEWRARIDPGDDAGWDGWARSYGAFVRGWAEIAEASGVDLLSVGVELRSWVTGPRAPSFAALVREIRGIYKGPLTYSGNWDDIEHTVVLGELDVIGVNAFYPLAEKDGATFEALLEGGQRVRERVRSLADAWQKPVLFTEVGYTTRRDPAIRPWEWPDGMKNVAIDEAAQAEAYRALLAPLLDEPRFMGFFVWRVYADPDDVSQEAGWGFSPRGKLAELVMRDAFAATWAGDAFRARGFALRATVPGLLPWLR